MMGIRRQRSVHANRRRALTFLEVTIAVSLLTLFMSSVYIFYSTTLTTRDQSETMARKTHLARVLLMRMAEEIQQASGFTETYGPGLIGYPDAISINTITVPDKILSQDRSQTDLQIPGQFDLRQITYYEAIDEENLDEEDNPRLLGMVRKETRTFLRDVIIEGEEEGEADEARAVKEELYSPEIKYLEFRYFDGASWWKTWELERGNTLPQMVRITIGYDIDPVMWEEEDEIDLIEEIFESDEEDIDPLPPQRYSIFIRLKQSDSFFGSRISREAASLSASAGL